MGEQNELVVEDTVEVGGRVYRVGAIRGELAVETDTEQGGTTYTVRWRLAAFPYAAERAAEMLNLPLEWLRDRFGDTVLVCHNPECPVWVLKRGGTTPAPAEIQETRHIIRRHLQPMSA